ncbi:hypothetical protein L21SP2_3469 [Salinispira pacifica]|uniref:Uncharacterized protein n=1 Tax=Salinispira pacifica TaxID=1307761 RepID=V5WMD5_9SPIO|nr:hypothetical protein L21SP2_3469 [Salinispira pacifica]
MTEIQAGTRLKHHQYKEKYGDFDPFKLSYMYAGSFIFMGSFIYMD